MDDNLQLALKLHLCPSLSEKSFDFMLLHHSISIAHEVFSKFHTKKIKSILDLHMHTKKSIYRGYKRGYSWNMC